MSSLSSSLFKMAFALCALLNQEFLIAQTDQISKNYYKTGTEFAKLRAKELQP